MAATTPLQTLKQLVADYQGGAITLATLEDRLADLVIPIDEGHDPEADDLAAMIWLLISEHDLGHRTEAEVRETLAEQLARPPAARQA